MTPIIGEAVLSILVLSALLTAICPPIMTVRTLIQRADYRTLPTWDAVFCSFSNSKQKEQDLTTDTEDDFQDTIGEIYVERDTSLLYEVKFFEDFVLVRPASPSFYLAIRKITHNEFANDFDEFYGDHEHAKDSIRNLMPEFIIE